MDQVLTLPKPFSLSVDDLRSGNRDAQDLVTDLYVKLRPSLLSYVYHLIGSTRDGEDIVQIAFIQLFDEMQKDVQIMNVRGWLYRVVHNLAIEQVRRGGRRETLARQWLGDQAQAAAHEAEIEIIRREEIERCLAMLNNRERECLMLRAEGLSYQEIAEVIDTTAKSVSVYLARGLKKIESKYEDKK